MGLKNLRFGGEGRLGGDQEENVGRALGPLELTLLHLGPGNLEKRIDKILALPGNLLVAIDRVVVLAQLEENPPEREVRQLFHLALAFVAGALLGYPPKLLHRARIVAGLNVGDAEKVLGLQPQRPGGIVGERRKYLGRPLQPLVARQVRTPEKPLSV